MIEKLDLQDRLLFAVPKKGRLYEQCLQLLSGADIQFRRKNRLDIALCTNLHVALVFLPASDIAKFVGAGDVDIGIKGQDVVAETDMESSVKEIMPLGFGKCKLCVQVPEKGSLKTLDALAGKRVVTSFERLAALHLKNIDQQHGTSTSISYISGSVEAACSLGLADAIVDLVESGDTMRAAGLHPIYTLLESQAVLISNPRSRHPELVETITNRIRGVIAASKHVLLKYNVNRDQLRLVSQITPGNRAPTISPLETENWVAVEAMITTDSVALTLDKLVAAGAKDILVFNIQNCRV